MALFALLGVLRGRLRHTGVRLTANPCLSRHSPLAVDGGCGLDQDKNCSFLNWTHIVFILDSWMNTNPDITKLCNFEPEKKILRDCGDKWRFYLV